MQLKRQPEAPHRGGRPLVTAAIPTFNGASTVGATIESVLAQTYDALEIVVLDDGSSDGTLDVVREMTAGDGRVRIIVNPNRLGLTGNFNACLVNGAGAWIKFVLQDDTIEPTCIERMVDALAPGADIVICGRRYIFEEAPAWREEACKHLLDISLARDWGDGHVPPAALAERVLRFGRVNFIGEPVATLISREGALAAGAFDRRLVHLLDYDFFIRLGLRGGVCIVADDLVSFRVHGGSETARQFDEGRFRAEIVDAVLLFVFFALDMEYEMLRSYAAQQNPPVDLTARAVVEARAARDYVRRHGAEATKLAWQTAVMDDPVVGAWLRTRLRGDDLGRRFASKTRRLASLPSRLLRGRN